MRGQKIKLAIFDYDGVIADSFGVLHKSYEAICSELGGFYEADFKRFRQSYSVAGNHINFLLSLGIPLEKHAQADVIYKREQARLGTPLFAGIEEVLQKISKNMKMVIVSANHKSEIILRLSKKNLLHLFQEVIGNEEDGKYLLKTEPIKQAVQRSGCSFSSSVAIGDRSRDFSFAREAGIPVGNIILVDYGWGYKETAVRQQGYCLNTRVRTPLDLIPAIEEIGMR
jgi:phosphoglycolate phosphatase-like HAD superfamily hydrolase